MSYTQSDVDSIRTAITTIASRGVAEVQYSDGRRVRYSSLDQLQNLLELVENEVDAATYGGSIPIIFTDPDS